MDTAFFYKMQPNYSQPSLRDIGVKGKNSIAVIDIGTILIGDRKREKERMKGDGVEAQNLGETDFLVAYLTIYCFSFKEKIFCMSDN